MPKVSLETWITNSIRDNSDGECTSISISHVLGSSLDEVYTHKLGGSSPLTAYQIGEVLSERARTHAQELEGTQLFRLLAFYSNRSEPQGKFHIRIQGESDFDGTVTERADAKGFLGQQMRLFEANTASTFRKDAMLFETMIRTQQINAENNVKLTQSVMENTKALTEMAAAFIKIQSEGRLEEIRLKAQMEERKLLIGMAPHLLNAATGKEIIPSAATEGDVFLELANTLSENEFKMIMEMLQQKNPRLATIVSSKLSSALKTQRENAESESHVTELLEPEVDASGSIN